MSQLLVNVIKKIAANPATPALDADEAIAISAAIKDYLDGKTKVLRGNITQAGTAAPTVTTTKNTIGAVVWARTGAGVYTGTLVGAFPVGTTARVNGVEPSGWAKAVRTSADVITITVAVTNGTATDALLNGAFIEIVVDAQ